jgi:hypothetical protein
MNQHGTIVIVNSSLSCDRTIASSKLLERGCPGKVLMWQFSHVLSTSQYSSRWNHCGLACCYATMNHLEHPLFCASCRYWCRCFRHQGNLYRSSLLLGLFLASSLILDLTGLGGPTKNLSSRRHCSGDHGEYYPLPPRRVVNSSGGTEQ